MSSSSQLPENATRRRASPVSVVIPARNAGDTLAEQLDSLAEQALSERFDVIVADNGSTDQTADIVADYADVALDVRRVDASARSGASYARNVGAAATEAEKLLFCDADDIVSPGWVGALAAGLDDHDLAGGPLVFDRTLPDEIDANISGRRTDGFVVPEGFMPFAPSCNLGVRRTAFDTIGGFCESYRRAEDVDFSWRAQVAGFDLGFVPEAAVSYRQRTTYRAVFWQGYHSGHDAPLLQRNFSRAGLRPRSRRDTLRQWGWLGTRVPTIVVARRRGMWVRHAGYALGRAAGRLSRRDVT
ncbi:MAG: glycosyltransferase [Actinomycetota bacterium]